MATTTMKHILNLCPEGSACVEDPNGTNYCYVVYENDSDCSFCRYDGTAQACTTEVDFVEPGDLSVCPPTSR